jgi:hypothetical protein
MREIPLTKGLVTQVDDEDYPELSKYKWHAAWDATTQSYRAQRVSNHQTIRMHRVITKALPGQMVDHWDHDTLNNQRFNLRACSNAQNTANGKIRSNNTSGFKGVSWHKHIKKWSAQIRVAGRLIPLGYFTDPVEAARNYDAKAVELFGDFAYTNF